MIQIHQSKTADTRSCDFKHVSKHQLLESTEQHLSDIAQGLNFFKTLIDVSIGIHDHDKISDLDNFHRCFIGGFEDTSWWDNHRKVNRHHLLASDGVPKDVNLVDVLDMIVDCVMAGKARTGTVYDLNMKPEVLMAAFKNTVELLKANVEVVGINEGEKCNRDGCPGTINLEPIHDCSCHISPPCESCVSLAFECSECGWRSDD